ncbi:MAG: class I SAM-dependent methyltransferase family protein [Candidatus Aenigmarchaeota archaeon]|nr:class I SAM-dependent methyltransferase family protein [Candidatus Aenigmarchaeota archaeon]
MNFRQKIARETGIREGSIPASYQVLGDVMLLKLMKASGEEKKKIASAVLELYPYIKTVCEIKGVEGELRRPKILKLGGNGTETTHKESGILYNLDAAKVMFSKGNHFERRRLLKQAGTNEVIVDMFAGIGYFSLPLARHVRKVYSLEKNPVAFRYLKENIKLNKLSNIEAVNADCREAALEGVADRLIMGYFPGTERFLPFALKMLKDGGIVHFHNSYSGDELWNKPAEDLKALGNFRVLEKKKVKSIAPRRWHIVMDVEVYRE